tara:strand:- start:947 stop:1081 length:135 start_codon:yes stop_codon:yes gene_type:complete
LDIGWALDKEDEEGAFFADIFQANSFGMNRKRIFVSIKKMKDYF